MYVLWFCNLYARQKLYRYRNFKRMRRERIQMEVLIFSSCILVYCLVHSDWWAPPSRCLLVSLHAAQVRVCVGTWGQSRDGISRNWILCTFAFNSQNLHGWPWIAGGFKIQTVMFFMMEFYPEKWMWITLHFIIFPGSFFLLLFFSS